MAEIEVPYRKTFMKTIVDEADVHLLAEYRWHIYKIHNRFYVRKTKEKRQSYLHQLILSTPEGLEIDHINRDGLDNRRENLRLVTHAVNIANTGMFNGNTSGFRGVINMKGLWRAQIKHKGLYLQSHGYRDKSEAALVRDELTRCILPEGSYLNLPNMLPKPEHLAEAQRLLAKRNWMKTGLK